MSDASARQRVIVVGTGGHARELAWLVRELERGGGYEFCGHVVDPQQRTPELPFANALLGPLERLNDPELLPCRLVLGVGAPRGRRELRQRIARDDAEFAILVHPRAIVGERIELEPGVCLAAQVVLTVDIAVGAFSCINVGVSLGHDTRVGRYANINPGARIAGAVQIDDGAEIGIGAVIRQGVRIGAGALVGAGAVVTKDVASNTVVAGVPARVLRGAPAW